MWVHEWSWVTFRVHQLWIILSGWDRHRAPKRLKNRWSLSREINGTCLARSCFSANWFPTFFCNFRANKLGEFSESGQSARNWQCLAQQSGPTSEHTLLHWHDTCNQLLCTESPRQTVQRSPVFTGDPWRLSARIIGIYSADLVTRWGGENRESN